MGPSAPRSTDRPDPEDTGVRVIPVTGLPEVAPGEDLVTLLAAALGAGSRHPLRDGDVLCIATKVVSKARGLLVPASRKDTAVEAATRRLVARRRHGSIVTSVVHAVAGPVMAAAGVDASNSPDGVLLLPEDPDAAARELRAGIEGALGVRIALVLTDTISRIWRVGVSDVALGASGLAALQDLRGTADATGRTLRMTQRALADECAAAADLVKGKSDGVPAAIVRGLPGGVLEPAREVGASALNRTGDDDWFRRPSLESVWQALGILPGREPVAQMAPEPDAERIDRALAVANDTSPTPAARIHRPDADTIEVVPTSCEQEGWVAAGALAERVRTALRAEEIAAPLPALRITVRGNPQDASEQAHDATDQEGPR